MRALAESVPGRTITLLTSPAGTSVSKLMGEVDATITHEAAWTRGDNAAHGDVELIERLRAERFDAAVIFTVFTQSAVPAAYLCRLAGIPLRLAHSRERPYALLTDWAPDPEPDQLVRHEVERQLALVAHVGARTTDTALRVNVSPADATRVQALMAREGLSRASGQGWLVVHPGSTAASRRYPIDLWARACARLTGEHALQIVLTGDAGDRELVAAIQSQVGSPTVSLAGRLSLGELAALLQAAPLLLSGNSGPVHLAAGVGTAVLDVYALTNPQHTPWGVPSRVLINDVPCRWCFRSVCPEGHHLCLRGIAPERIVEAALQLLEAPQEAARRAVRRRPSG